LEQYGTLINRNLSTPLNLKECRSLCLRCAPKIGMLITIPYSSLATYLVWPAEGMAWNCVSYIKLSMVILFFLCNGLLRDGSSSTHALQRPVVHTTAHQFSFSLHCSMLSLYQYTTVSLCFHLNTKYFKCNLFLCSFCSGTL